MRLRQLRSDTTCVTVNQDTPIWRVAQTMMESGCNFLPVLRARKPVGVITGTDIAIRYVGRRAQNDNVPVKAIMSTPAITADGDLDSKLAVLIMRENHVHRLVLTEGDGDFVGVVSLGDLVGNAASESIAENLRRHVEASSVRPSEAFMFSIPGVPLQH